MLTDYSNNRVEPSFDGAITGKWYGITRHKGCSFIKIIDSFVFISLKNNSVIEMTLVSFDVFNRKKISSFCGRVVAKTNDSCLVVAKGLLRKRIIILGIDAHGFLYFSGRNSVKKQLFSKKIPVSKADVDGALLGLSLDKASFLYNECNVV